MIRLRATLYKNRNTLLAGASFSVVVASRYGGIQTSKKLSTLCEENGKKQNLTKIPTRSEQVNGLSSKEFDILVVGGGATGCGAALDAASRGLSTALIERGDFGTETSARSTKLLWVSFSFSFSIISVSFLFVSRSKSATQAQVRA